MVLFLKLFLMSLNVFYNQVFGQKGIDRTNDVSYGNIIKDRFQYLNERSITSTTVQHELDCAVLCIERPTCVSFQVKAAQAGSHGSRTCELLATDKFHSKQNLVHRSDYHYYTFYSKCHNTPCQNNATCLPNYENQTYICNCPKKYYGEHCQYINWCFSGPCKNNGTCTSSESSYNCTCKEGWNGKQCEEDVNECHTMARPCLNQGACVNDEGSYRCQCKPGWKGKKCEEEINECAANPCQNQGTCTNTAGSYSCQCKSDWKGQHCEQKAGLNIFIHSQGGDDVPNMKGNCFIKVNNVERCPNTRGHNIVVLDKFGVYKKRSVFDTHDDLNAGVNMKNFLTNLPNERIVLIAVMDSGETYVRDAEAALRSVGAVNPTAVHRRSSWLLVGYKGGSPSWITEKSADSSKGPCQANVTIPIP